tara:strand:+ start:1171 stop:1788 length:618 start_codon:yes stop_codon:yes gene_type:complete
MYTCKQIRNIVKQKFKYTPLRETVQDSDYFDFIKRGIKRLHRILTGVNDYYYRKFDKSYNLSPDLDTITDFPADLYKVITWYANPDISKEAGTWVNYHWCEATNEGTRRGLYAIMGDSDNTLTSSEDLIAGTLEYVREPDMPTNWASTPDVPDGYDDWLIQYVITEVFSYTNPNPNMDLGKLKELDEIVINMNRQGGAAGQVADS